MTSDDEIVWMATESCAQLHKNANHARHIMAISRLIRVSTDMQVGRASSRLISCKILASDAMAQALGSQKSSVDHETRPRPLLYFRHALRLLASHCLLDRVVKHHMLGHSLIWKCPAGSRKTMQLQSLLGCRTQDVHRNTTLARCH